MDLHATDGASDGGVLGIYPSTPVVPVNLLRIYIQFSRRMSEGWARRAVRVCRALDGAPLDGVFLDMSLELWDPQRTRLTLLLDPGRIKRGLVPNLEAGYPLVEGQAIDLTVAADFRDAAGLPLRESATRHYEVGPAVRSRVDHSRWRYAHPRSGSIDPFNVVFDRPLDRGLLEHCLVISDEAGTQLSGTGSVGADERSWHFQPDIAWDERPHTLRIDTRLEDLAGNSLRRVFDRDLSRREDDPEEISHAAVELIWQCSAGSRPNGVATSPTR